MFSFNLIQNVLLLKRKFWFDQNFLIVAFCGNYNGVFIIEVVS